MANIVGSVSSIIVIAMLLIAGMVIFSQFHADQRTDSIHELGVTKNESIAFTSNTTANNPVKYDSTFKLYCNSTLMTQGTNYSVNFDSGLITYLGSTIGGVATCGTHLGTLGVNTTYTYYGGSAFDAIEKVGTQTNNAFKLGALLPYVLAAVALIGILIAGFAFSRRED